jgi:hypothetical protein
MDRQIKKMFIQTMEYLAKKEIMSFAGKWIE